MSSGHGTCNRRVLRQGGPCGVTHPTGPGALASPPHAAVASADPFAGSGPPRRVQAPSGKTHAAAVDDYTMCGTRTGRMTDTGPVDDIDGIGCLLCRGGCRRGPEDPGAKVFAAAGAYPVRQALKAAGAVWHPQSKSWLATRRMLDTVQDDVLADGWAYFHVNEHPSQPSDAVFWKNITEWQPQRRSRSAGRYRALVRRRAELLAAG